jgi:hypothetical protein
MSTRPGQLNYLGAFADSGRPSAAGPDDAAACLLLECYPDLLGRETERLCEVVADRDRERLAEPFLVAVTAQIQLERLRLDAELPRPVLHAGDVEIRRPVSGQTAVSSSLIISTSVTPGLGKVSRPAS